MEHDVVVAAVLPVTDTVKVLEDGPGGPVVGHTLDRDGLRRLVSPLVLPPSVVAAMDDWPSDDLVDALGALREGHRVELVEAPTSAMRVRDRTDLARLEALTDR